MWPNKHAFNHKLFHIYNYAEITKILQTCLSILVGSPTDPFTELQLFDWITYTEVWASTSLSLLSHPEFLCLSIMSKLIYKFLLPFIGKLEFASPWIYSLDINGCNNYLPNNLTSEINLTSWHCQIVDSSLLSDWPTRFELILTLEELVELQYESTSN